MELRSITVETLAAFAQALRAEERCTETIKQYTRSVRQFAAWLAPETVAAGSAGGEDQQTPHDSADTDDGEQEREHARRVQFPGRQGCRSQRQCHADKPLGDGVGQRVLCRSQAESEDAADESQCHWRGEGPHEHAQQ